MSTKIVYLDNIIGTALNTPKVDGRPLYTRIDNQDDKGFNSATKTDKWIKTSEKTFNSPTNIRRIFITGSKIVINFYKPVIIGGKSSGTCWKEVPINIEGRSLFEIINETVNYDSLYSKYLMEKQISKDTKEPSRYDIRGTGIGGLINPWVLSNIEEVYFDWTILTGDKYKNNNQGTYQIFQEYAQGRRGKLDNDAAYKIFSLAALQNVNDLRTRFPRLKVVGFISELGKILSTSYYKGKQGMSVVDNMAETWYKNSINAQLIASSNSLISISDMGKGLPVNNTVFFLRDGIYKFDQMVLSRFVEDYKKVVSEKKKVIAEELKSQAKENSLEEKKEDKSEFEQMLDAMKETRGIHDTKSLIVLTLMGLKKSEVEDIFSEMSTDGAKEYKKMIGM